MPIDWAALAADRKLPTQKGEKRAKWETEKAIAVKTANRLARRDAAIARRAAIRKANRRPGEVQGPILRSMEPGQWYARPDLKILTGLSYDKIKGAIPRMEKADFSERAKNPDWVPVDYTGRQVHTVTGHQPTWLYRLTAKGEAWRLEALAGARWRPGRLKAI